MQGLYNLQRATSWRKRGASRNMGGEVENRVLGWIRYQEDEDTVQAAACFNC
jgi:hypothetical protein